MCDPTNPFLICLAYVTIRFRSIVQLSKSNRRTMFLLRNPRYPREFSPPYYTDALERHASRNCYICHDIFSKRFRTGIEKNGHERIVKQLQNPPNRGRFVARDLRGVARISRETRISKVIRGTNVERNVKNSGGNRE